ncbi:hypothetical protein E2493_15550 [Sphingomonas parva]|uniref:Circumsporozoite protein n=1 Tax=Sphingomonas parva TaxID=2555898 RepID=A0A4Y8ZQ69_9SPHN|nr:hypothetical protein [Sphingomonas parva]TFI57285.1 hypothetical protein E2493_15550 [Sphingomonas parva]
MATGLLTGSMRGLSALAVPLTLAACGSPQAADSNNTISAAEANALLQAAEENAAALAQDEDLANRAAADEAADMDVFGGNAAAGEGANSAPDLAADNDTGT